MYCYFFYFLNIDSKSMDSSSFRFLAPLPVEIVSGLSEGVPRTPWPEAIDMADGIGVDGVLGANSRELW